MKSKTWILTLVSLTLVIVIMFGTVMYCFDPLLQYGTEGSIFSYYTYTEIYGNPGIAKNYEYNAVFLGSSMVENADVSEIDRLFDCKTVKLPYSGGSSYNHKHILDVCYQSGNDIDKVFWALDEYAFTTDKDTPRYPLPEYLYDYDKTNDLSYILNLDVFYYYIVKNTFRTLANRQEPFMKDGSWCEDETIYNRNNALASIDYPLEANASLGKDIYAASLHDNLRYNVLPFVQEHPETEFYFYFPPYSISYWYMSKQAGTLDAEIHILNTVVEELLRYDNVRIFFFQDEESIITNLDNYKDYSHFKPSINSEMSNQMANGQNRLTAETYQRRIDSFHAYLTEFDYDAFYLEQQAGTD